MRILTYNHLWFESQVSEMTKQKTKFVILGLLTIEPMSGYDIKKMIGETIGHFWSESNGQLYPALSQLVNDRLIVLEEKQKKGKKESHLYAITDLGREALETWLGEDIEGKNIQRDEELLKLFFGKNASPSTTVQLLQKREKRVKEKLDQFLLIQKELATLTTSPHHLYWSLSLKNGIYRAQAELRWCQESIQAIKKG